jgi:glycosyltransferase involved in cell wall biosynthesis
LPESCRFIICGEFVQGYREVLRTQLARPGVEARGFTEDVGTIMSQADVLVLPSIEEGSALVTYEARGAGCVVLASDASGAVGTHGLDVLLHPARDVDCLAGQLRELSADRRRLEQLRHESLRSVGKLQWAEAAHVLLERYGEASADGRAKSGASGSSAREIR